MGMAEDECAPRTDIIDKLVAVFIKNPGAFALFYEQRVSPDRLKSPHRAVDTSGDVFLRFFKKSLRKLKIIHLIPAIFRTSMLQLPWRGR